MTFGNLVISFASLPALVLWCLTFIVFAHRVHARRLGAIAPLTLGCLVALFQGLAAIIVLKPAGVGLSAPWLGGSFAMWVVVYAIARWAGVTPQARWPWYRFGLAAAIGVLVTDVIVGAVLPAGAGRAWMLGGAGLWDALGVLPAFLAGAYYLLNDCRSPWTICHISCRGVGHCRHGVHSHPMRLDRDSG